MEINMPKIEVNTHCDIIDYLLLALKECKIPRAEDLCSELIESMFTIINKNNNMVIYLFC